MEEFASETIGEDATLELRAALDMLFKRVKKRERTEIESGRIGQTYLTCGANKKYCWNKVCVNEKLFEREGNKELISSINKVLDKHDPTFRYSTVHVNKNYPGSLHTDFNNAGDSRMIVVGGGEGDVKGGQLWYQGKLIETKDRIVAFDGNLPHMTMPYEGDRYSIILYTFGGIATLDGGIEALSTVRKWGIRSPVNIDSVLKMKKQYPTRKTRLLTAREHVRSQMHDLYEMCVPKMDRSQFEELLVKKMDSKNKSG
jgi:hypothetical protein